MQTALVRFEGNSGHDADVTRCQLMTQSGRRRFAIAGDCYVDDRVRFSSLFSRNAGGQRIIAAVPGQRRYLSGMTISCSVVSTMNMASSRAGFVELALALTLWWSPGISVQLSPAL